MAVHHPDTPRALRWVDGERINALYVALMLVTGFTVGSHGFSDVAFVATALTGLAAALAGLRAVAVRTRASRVDGAELGDDWFGETLTMLRLSKRIGDDLTKRFSVSDRFIRMTEAMDQCGTQDDALRYALAVQVRDIRQLTGTYLSLHDNAAMDAVLSEMMDALAALERAEALIFARRDAHEAATLTVPRCGDTLGALIAARQDVDGADVTSTLAGLASSR